MSIDDDILPPLLLLSQDFGLKQDETGQQSW
jgi:hypothetical protein